MKAWKLDFGYPIHHRERYFSCYETASVERLRWLREYGVTYGIDAYAFITEITIEDRVLSLVEREEPGEGQLESS